MPSSRKISRSSKPSAQSLKATPSARRTLIPKPPSLTPLGSARVSADGPDTMENRDLWSCSKDGSTSTPQNTAPLSPTQSHLCESDSQLGGEGRVRRASRFHIISSRSNLVAAAQKSRHIPLEKKTPKPNATRPGNPPTIKTSTESVIARNFFPLIRRRTQ